MSLSFSVSKEDLLRSKLLTPGVYVFDIRNITQGPGKNDPQSTTTTIDLVVSDGPDKGGIGVPVPYWISEKAAGLAVGFLEAVFNSKLPEDGANLDLSAAIGRRVKAYVKNEKYQNRMQNKIEGFLPMTA